MTVISAISVEPGKLAISELDFEILKSVKNFNIPIIFQGGVGNAKHLLEGFKNKYIDAAATANLLNFVGNGIKNARDIISNKKINLPQR